MTIIEKLLENHPVRKTKKQKEAFRSWLIGEAAAMGYTAQEEKAKGYASTNLVVGNPETAQVTYTAHYDTPPVMPLPNFITPKNIFFYLLYQLVLTFGFLVISAAAAALAGFLTKDPAIGMLVGMAACMGVLYLLMCGPANKHCANDNTSGVAAVMEIMARLPEEERSRAAFILFDNEEKGLLGSAGYAAQHKGVKEKGLIINLDCVGDGENILFFANKKTRALPQYALLQEALQAQTGRNLLMEEMEKCMYPSDQANYKLGIAVCACNHGKVLGYYVDKIHTPKDTVCEQANLDFLADGLVAFAAKLPQEAAALSETRTEADDPKAKTKKLVTTLVGLAAAIVGLALLMVYIRNKGEMPVFFLIGGSLLFGFGLAGFFGGAFAKK